MLTPLVFWWRIRKERPAMVWLWQILTFASFAAILVMGILHFPLLREIIIDRASEEADDRNRIAVAIGHGDQANTLEQPGLVKRDGQDKRATR